MVVANGHKIASNTGVRVFLQGVYLEIDFYLLPLGGFEAVLGAQWLRMLGPILWDFGELLMKFILRGQTVELKGLASLRNQLVEGEQFAKEIRKSKVRKKSPTASLWTSWSNMLLCFVNHKGGTHMASRPPNSFGARQ